MTDRELMKIALKFCEDIGDLDGPYPYVNGTGIVSDSRKVSKALRDRLAQPDNYWDWFGEQVGNKLKEKNHE